MSRLDELLARRAAADRAAAATRCEAPGCAGVRLEGGVGLCERCHTYYEARGLLATWRARLATRQAALTQELLREDLEQMASRADCCPRCHRPGDGLLCRRCRGELAGQADIAAAEDEADAPAQELLVTPWPAATAGDPDTDSEEEPAMTTTTLLLCWPRVGARKRADAARRGWRQSHTGTLYGVIVADLRVDSLGGVMVATTAPAELQAAAEARGWRVHWTAEPPQPPAEVVQPATSSEQVLQELGTMAGREVERGLVPPAQDDAHEALHEAREASRRIRERLAPLLGIGPQEETADVMAERVAALLEDVEATVSQRYRPVDGGPDLGERCRMVVSDLRLAQADRDCQDQVIRALSRSLELVQQAPRFILTEVVSCGMDGCRVALRGPREAARRCAASWGQSVHVVPVSLLQGESRQARAVTVPAAAPEATAGDAAEVAP